MYQVQINYQNGYRGVWIIKVFELLGVYRR
jgi:hypothetical protein